MEAMGLRERKKNGLNAQERFTVRLLESRYPQATVEREPFTIQGPTGKSALLDFQVYLPGSPVAVLLEVTELSINTRVPNNKADQQKIVNYFLDHHRQYRALFLYAEAFISVGNLCQSLSILEQLASGQILSYTAQEQADHLAWSTTTYNGMQRLINWEQLLTEVQSNSASPKAH